VGYSCNVTGEPNGNEARKKEMLISVLSAEK
jgi:hypothetical protein